LGQPGRRITVPGQRHAERAGDRPVTVQREHHVLRIQPHAGVVVQVGGPILVHELPPDAGEVPQPVGELGALGQRDRLHGPNATEMRPPGRGNSLRPGAPVAGLPGRPGPRNSSVAERVPYGMSQPMPVLYLSHGAPPLADDAVWPAELAAWSARLPKPRAVLVVSAHWEAAPLTIGATSTRPLVYDFWGFPQRYYDVQYPAPGAPELAAEVRRLLAGAGYPTADAPDRGLDHGAYVPLMEMYPQADVPVLQISMPS